jgi:hypothetical protein
LIKKKTKVAKTKGQFSKGIRVAKKVTKKKIRRAESLLRQGFRSNNVAELAKIGKKYGIDSETEKDYGFGLIDLVWNIKFHPAFDPIAVGFVKLKEQEAGSSDLKDGQFSLRKIEEAMMAGIRSGMDRTYILCDNEEIAKSVTGQIEWLSSFGCLIRFDAYASAVFPGQKEQLKITPSETRHEKKIEK